MPPTEGVTTPPERHHPTHMSGGGNTWVYCSCGWRSATWTNIVEANLNFGRHLVLVGGVA